MPPRARGVRWLLLSTLGEIDAKQVNGDPGFRVFTHLLGLSRTVASEPASPSTKTLVLSAHHGERSFLAYGLEPPPVGQLTEHGSDRSSSRRYGTRAELVRIASHSVPRLELVHRDHSRSTARCGLLPPIGISVTGTSTHTSPASISLRRSTEAAKAVS